MTVAGLTLPFLSEADPEQSGEGSLDPLGLAPLADRLAEEIASGITARMSRIRFVTAIVVEAVATERLADAVAADGVSPAYLAFEWHVVEAFGRDRHLPAEVTFGVPGIAKARSAVARGIHMDAASYLKVPKVFGFTGVYKRLARAIEVVDDQLLPGLPIVVYEPFLEGTQDEKQFRVVKDRERWFNVVMGEKLELDERSTERLAERVPLPAEVAAEIALQLEV